MERGFIKLWRSIDQNELLENDNTALVVFIKLLLKCNRTDGTLVTGRKKLANICNLNPNTLYSALKRLETSTMIQQRSNNVSTTIRICNWSKYQQGINSSSTVRRVAINTIQEREIEIDTKVSKSNSNELKSLHEEICAVFSKNPERYKLLPARRKTLSIRMKDAGRENIIKACTAVSKSDWHMGDNDRGWIADPYWCLSSAEKTETWANKEESTAGYTGDLRDLEIEI